MASFSIVLPVKNGGEHLKLCVDSILSQSYPDLELVILENCSTDGTVEWLQKLTDPRVRVISSKEPLSIVENWSRITGIEKREYMTLIGHDDLLDKDYLSIMAGLIDRFPDASLYLAHFRYIGANGQKIRSCLPMNERQSPDEMLSNFLQNKFNVSGTGYVFRSKDYDALGGIPPYPNLLFADFELWLGLAMRTYLAVAKQECFAFRIHESTTTTSGNRPMLLAFERFAAYLEGLIPQNSDFAGTIDQHAGTMLHFYCRGLTSRLLRTAPGKREGLTVKEIIQKFKAIGDRLITGKQYDPLGNTTVRVAKYIDSNVVTRRLFLLFKKLYPKPVVR